MLFKQEVHDKFLFSRRVRCAGGVSMKDESMYLHLLAALNRLWLHKEYIKQGRKVAGECRKNCRGGIRKCWSECNIFMYKIIK